jgi:hypothetical protein
MGHGCKGSVTQLYRFKSADAKADVADGFAAEALFEFPEDFGFRDLLKLV